MDDRQKRVGRYQLIMAVCFLAIAASFVFDVWGTKREVITHEPVDPKFFTKETMRQPKFEPVTQKDGKTYGCNECHQTLEPSRVKKPYYFAHPEVELDHGINNYCKTCHSPNNLDKFLDINKDEVAFNQSEKACFQCHGPIYRDWEKGVHGRMKDYWDERKKDVKKITCVQCHDPHHPKFPLMQPAPPPAVENYQNFLGQYTTQEESHHE